MKNENRFLIGMVIIFLSGCGKYNRGIGTDTNDYAIDAVKSISKSSGAKNDQGSYRQVSYELNQERSLLMRLEDLLSREHSIAALDPSGVTIEVTLLSGEINSLKLCPLTTPWMMLATWTQAHPFGGEGKWRREGGDYNLSDCMSPVVGSKPNRAKFVITQWFLDYPRARRENAGWILISDKRVTISGDKSATEYPRISYAKGF